MRASSIGTAALALTLIAGCGGGSAAGAGFPGGSTARVLYAGSLVNLMEKQIGPAFADASGDHYQGRGSDSQSIANAIKGKVQVGDVFIAASPTVNTALMGPSNGSWETWYTKFASAPLELGYSSRSKFAPALQSGNWYDVLRSPGIRIGITDPTLDPKGKLTIEALDTAQQAYHLPATYAASIRRKASIFPEQDLLGRLEAGQLDVGFFYSNEAVPAHIPTVGLGKAHESATFTVSVLQNAPDPTAGAAFVRYLLGPARSTLTAGGLHMFAHPELTGPRSAVPTDLRSVVGGMRPAPARSPHR